MQNQQQPPERPETGEKTKAFFTGAIVAASALIGGLAVVLWNRKALARLRQHPEPGAGPVSGESEEES
jgi:LPXTG-motif cell wall-anchored protein